MIKPEELIKQLGVEGLIRTADNYYAKVVDPTPILAKPFFDSFSGAIELNGLGQLLGGLRLAPTMTVMDFGGGVGWLSRLLQQMRCHVICLDPSTVALETAQRLFQDYPPIGRPLSEPVFLPFDGLSIQLPDNSVDRIISFSAFHHVPNPEHVLAEMFRVLKPGGIVGFVEPGAGHSSQPQSQFEMTHFDVLENDLDLHALLKSAATIGFKEPRFRLTLTPFYDASPTEFFMLHDDAQIPASAVGALFASTRQSYVFFLTKGDYRADSRQRAGLNGTLALEASRVDLSEEKPLKLTLQVRNTGTATWLHQNTADIGMVMTGARLLASTGETLHDDFGGARLLADVPPGQAASMLLELPCPPDGQYQVSIALVAHHVCWFEVNGAVPLRLLLTVKTEADLTRHVTIVPGDSAASTQAQTESSSTQPAHPDPAPPAQTDIPAMPSATVPELQAEVIRLNRLVKGYEQGRFIRLMRWLKRSR